MSFLALSPAMAALLLAATAAVVGALYWLKPPPRIVIVPSKLLWDRLLREKRRSNWLDRLRWWVSLIVALAIGLSVAMALGRPEMDSAGNERLNMTIVVDNSATMATRRADGYTRFEHAVDQARALLMRGSAASEFMIVDTAGQAPPTEPSDRRAALDVLDNLTVSLGDDTHFPSLAGGAEEVYFVTDGVMVSDAPPEAGVISVFEAADNVGITAFEIRSVPATPLMYQAFLEVTNNSPGPKEVDIRLRGSGDSRLGETIGLAPGESYRRTIDLQTFDRGPVRAAITTDRDAFSADDYAYSYLPVRSRTRIALVSPGSVFLETALGVEPRISLEFLTPDTYTDRVVADLYVFDRFAPRNPPRGPALLFLPPDVPWLAPALEVLSSPQVPGWDAEHPVLRFVSLDDLRIDRAIRTQVLPAAAAGRAGNSLVAGTTEVIVGTPQLPLITVSENPEKIVRVSFALEDSNFPLQPGFPIFLSNALSWMMDEQVAVPSSPGRVEVRLAAAAVQDLEGNDVAAWSLPDRTVFVAEEPGLYTATRGGRRLRVAVNLADRQRSAVNATQVAAGAGMAARPQTLGSIESPGWADELWVLLVTIATVLVIVEWFTYHKRITV